LSTKTTYLIIGLNLLIYLVMLKVAGPAELQGFHNATLLRFGADFAPLVADGQWWRAVTSMFIHITPIHILMNMIALYQVGVVLEPHYGRMRYMLLYIAAGLGGSAASLAWNWSDPVVSAGASGAISGLIAAGAVSGHMLVGLSKGAKQYRDAMVRWLVMIVAYGLFAHVDAAAHAGGMAVGAGISWLLDRNGRAIRRAQDEAQRDQGLGWEVLLLFVVVAGSFYLASRAQNQLLPPKPDDAAGSFEPHGLNPSPASDNADELHRQTFAVCTDGEAADCAAAARRWSTVAPDDDGPWMFLEMAENKLGHVAEAGEAAAQGHRVMAKQLLDRAPGDPDPEDDPTTDLRALRVEALKHPDDIAAQSSLAEGACALKAWKECATAAKRAVRLDSTDPDLWSFLRRASFHLGRSDDQRDAENHLREMASYGKK
jgi:membrane associated rhomboid family serine protease